MAQSHGPAALAGTVSSTDEGKMEGVVVSAKRPGSTIMVSVSTNAQGQYSFPEGRLAPGAYDITMRAIGYTLPSTKATIRADGSTQLDLKLAKWVRPAPKYTRGILAKYMRLVSTARRGAGSRSSSARTLVP